MTNILYTDKLPNFRSRNIKAPNRVATITLFCLYVPILKQPQLFVCFPKGDREHGINRGLRPHAFEKGSYRMDGIRM
jgi:hypothetical protein